jgi:gem associated protein 2
MFTQKPCLPVSTPRKRKRQAQSHTLETTSDENHSTLGEDDDVACDGDRGKDVDSNDEIDDSDTETDAASYLYSVREEARLLPDIWTARTPSIIDGQQIASSKLSFPPSKASSVILSDSKRRKDNTSVANLTLGSMVSLQYLTSHRTKIYPPPTVSHIPQAKKAWVDQTLADFSKLRLYLEHCKGIKDDIPSERQPVPPMKDFMAWYTFCIGRHHVFPRDDADISSTVTQCTQVAPTPAWEVNLPPNGHGYTPSVRLLLQMDQVMVRRVLFHLTSYVDHVSSDNRQNGCFVWIYALFARLERPIHRDDAVTLFSLLKRLTLLRFQIPESALLEEPVDTESLKQSTTNDKVTPNDDNIDNEPFGTLNDRQYLAILNTLIAIIGVYFEQGGNYSQIMEVPLPS